MNLIPVNHRDVVNQGDRCYLVSELVWYTLGSDLRTWSEDTAADPQRSAGAIDGTSDDLPHVADMLATVPVTLLGTTEIQFATPPSGSGDYAPDNSTANLFANTRLRSAPGVSIRYNMPRRFGLYGKATLSPASNVASPPAIRCANHDVIVANAWSATPSVGDLIWVQQYSGETPNVSGCSYDVRALGAAILGTTNATAAALYGGGGTLHGLTIILNVAGAGNQTLTLNGATNTASVDALIAAVVAKWPALWQVGLGGASSNGLMLAGASIVVGAGTANTALGFTAGAADKAAVLLDRSIVWPHTIGDAISFASESPSDVELDFTGASITGHANQPIEFTQATRARVIGANYRLSESQIPVGATGMAFCAFDVASRDCEFSHNNVEFSRLAGSTYLPNGLYCQSNDRTMLLNDRFSRAKVQGYAFLDCFGSSAINTWTDGCAWGHAIQCFDDTTNPTYGSYDCAIIGGGDTGSGIGAWVWGSKRSKLVGFSSTKNSQYGVYLDRNSDATSLTNVSATACDIGLYTQTGIDSTVITQLNTDGCRVGITSSGSLTVYGWRHHSTHSAASACFANVAGTKPVLISGVDLLNTTGGANGSGIIVQATSTVVIDGGRIECGVTASAINVIAAATVRLSNLTVLGGIGINCSAGTVVIGPNCDFSGITPSQQIALSGTGKVVMQQTGGILEFSGNNRFLLLAECYNTTINIATGSAATVVGIVGIPGLQFTVINNTDHGIAIVSSAAGDTGVTVATNKTAIVRVNSTKNCVRVTADT